jgi:hypothetical protein
MLSQTLSQLLERARARFGLEVEILDMGLRSVYPEGSAEFGQLAAGSPGLRRTLLDAMLAGRPQDVQQSGQSYRVYPLRQSVKRRQAAGLMAIKRPPARALPQDVEPWSELALAIVEADLVSADLLREERQRSRQYLGVLRFLELLMDAADESALAVALVQAAAVWHDADARVYRRSLAGDFVLHTCLPGIRPENRASRISARVLETGGDLKRLGPEADTILRVIARVAASRLDAFGVAHAQATRRHFEDLAAQGAAAPELTAMRIVHELVHRTGAGSGALVLVKAGETRRIAAVGSQGDSAERPLEPEGFRADRCACLMELGSDCRAVLELRAARDAELAPEAAAATRACADVLKTWLAGTLSALQNAEAVLDSASFVSDFSRRIHEELERAKRFDLDLALILVDIAAPAAALADFQETLRRELRGSDVLGATGSRQVAALLTHTDDMGLDRVVGRLKHRLADAAGRLNVSGLRLGRAALSADCRTAEALLAEAALSAEPVIIH